MDKSVTTKIIAALLTVFLLVTVISQFAIHSENGITTEVAMRYESQDALVFDGVFVRNEHTVTGNVSGVLRYEHADGSKLGKNSVIASVYNSAGDIQKKNRITALNERIDSLTDAQSLAGTDNSQIEAFNKLITEKHSELVKALYENDYAAARKTKYELLNLQSKRDMAKGKSEDYSAVINTLEQQVSDLELSISSDYESIYSEESGYFVSTADGYEDELSFDTIDALTEQRITEIVNDRTEHKNSGDVIGKMIEDYSWMLAAVIDTNEAIVLEEKTYVTLMAGASTVPIRAYIESMEKNDSGNTVVIFSSDVMTESVTSKRTERFRISLEDYSGIRISASAIHFDEENNMGVYIKTGSQAEFRRIKLVYSGEDFVIAEDTTALIGYLSLYDNIITEGKNLYDGKVL
ncbi:MAG: hypothetical protein J1E39_08670 [Eubacterium sp.]|nr:hypothetical protein [Eubacterium sp.]